MKTNKITAKDLMSAGYTEGKILGKALSVAEQLLQDMDVDVVLSMLTAVLDDEYDGELNELRDMILEDRKVSDIIVLKEQPEKFAIYGADNIDEGAKTQMGVAMALPVSKAGALMPDAHQGYGLPIGGVLATHNAVIPYGVGVDIGCRMALSIFDIPATHFDENHDKYKRELIAHTKFGAGHGYLKDERAQHAVLDNDTFNMTQFISQLKDKAYSQLGTSGGGNHFVEWGVVEFSERDEVLNIDKGSYVALLTHSGSRGMGAQIAGHYTRIAKDICKLPQHAVNLAYLDMNSEVGQEYWLAMNLAGDYASACHDIIHQKLAKAIGGALLAKVENHHNFAWKEKWGGEEVIVHRKGATPAGKGVMGIIPGSMTAPGFLVRGKGLENAINSASHGAGRQMSRTKAINNITKQEMSAILKENKVTLIGAGLDEAPMAYKDINMVMGAQKDLVDIVAKFQPRIVRMADDGSKED
ncbi:RtcB family protein [Chitinophaga sp. YR573]|uniref:RtcB family protein n=1 Tax=Chitinophaga sp. YR573 TaxID=1881040 RepID=UPI000B7E80E2|nr:RtcB family protein [Chitinophaga sp. YR573]